MMHFFGQDFRTVFYQLALDLPLRPVIEVGEWQAMDVSDSPAHRTHEMTNVIVLVDVPLMAERWQHIVRPDLPWAEDHFQERVSGEALNPPPSHVDWLYAVRGNEGHTNQGQFDHTYPERYWPKFANVGNVAPNGRQVYVPHMGIRFEYGDLNDVLALLVSRPLTRQAYLPVFFPEDTGGSDRIKGRVPCSLGYHFMIREEKLHCNYFIRSCDLYRHFKNDVYMTGRLMQWMCFNLMAQLGYRGLRPGELSMFISSLHVMVGDVPRLETAVKQ